MREKTGKVNITASNVRLNIPNYYVKTLGLSEETAWRIKETPTAYLLRNEQGGTIFGRLFKLKAGKYEILKVNIPSMEIDRDAITGEVLWEVSGRTVKATLPKGRRIA